YRGDLISMEFNCLFWVDGNRVARWKECLYSNDFDGKDSVTVWYTVPPQGGQQDIILGHMTHYTIKCFQLIM
ncbi:32610_t:CDS:1, partial [Racocetra persica]